MLVKIQNLRTGCHGFGNDIRLQFRAGEIKEIDTEWLKPFDNKAADDLFAGPVPSFRVVRTAAEEKASEGLLARLSMPVNVPKPAQEPVTGVPKVGPQNEAELLAAINDQQAKASAAQGGA